MRLYEKDAYQTTFSGKVLSCEEDGKRWKILLDQSCFYPEGGGQPADSGVIAQAKVLDVQEKNGEVVLKKHTVMGDMLELATQYAETLNRTTDFTTCITDTETIIAVSGSPKKDYIAREISEHVLNVMEDRAIWSTKDDKIMPLIVGDSILRYRSQIIAPIICEGDAIGTVIMFSSDYDKPITKVEYKLAQNAANFLAKQMES